MILAIVGSVSLAGNKKAQAVIERVLDELKPEEVVSGGAVGIDTMAANEAKKRGIKVTEFLPAVRNWEKGFKPRNLKIAQHCTALVRIVTPTSKTYGSGWTRDRAKEIGKETWEYLVDGD